MASKRVILTLEQRVNVIKKLDAGISCRAVAQETGCGKTQITRIKQDRHEIMTDWQSAYSIQYSTRVCSHVCITL